MIREMQYDMPRLPTSIASCKDRLICYIFLKDEQKLCGLGGGIFGCEMSPRLGWDEKETSSPEKKFRLTGMALRVAGFMKAASGLYPHEHGPLSLAKTTDAEA